MKVVSSLKSLKKRDINCKVVRRRGKLYVINKKNPNFFTLLSITSLLITSFFFKRTIFQPKFYLFKSIFFDLNQYYTIINIYFLYKKSIIITAVD